MSSSCLPTHAKFFYVGDYTQHDKISSMHHSVEGSHPVLLEPYREASLSTASATSMAPEETGLRNGRLNALHDTFSPTDRLTFQSNPICPSANQVIADVVERFYLEVKGLNSAAAAKMFSMNGQRVVCDNLCPEAHPSQMLGHGTDVAVGRQSICDQIERMNGWIADAPVHWCFKMPFCDGLFYAVAFRMATHHERTGGNRVLLVENFVISTNPGDFGYEIQSSNLHMGYSSPEGDYYVTPSEKLRHGNDKLDLSFDTGSTDVTPFLHHSFSELLTAPSNGSINSFFGSSPEDFLGESQHRSMKPWSDLNLDDKVLTNDVVTPNKVDLDRNTDWKDYVATLVDDSGFVSEGVSTQCTSTSSRGCEPAELAAPFYPTVCGGFVCNVDSVLDPRGADFGMPYGDAGEAFAVPPPNPQPPSFTSVYPHQRSRAHHNQTPLSSTNQDWGLRDGEKDKMVYVSWLPRVARAENVSLKKQKELNAKDAIIKLGFKGLRKVLLYPPSSAHCKLLFESEKAAKEFLLRYGGREQSPGSERWKRDICQSYDVNIKEGQSGGISSTKVKVVWADERRQEVTALPLRADRASTNIGTCDASGAPLLSPYPCTNI